MLGDADTIDTRHSQRGVQRRAQLETDPPTMERTHGASSLENDDTTHIALDSVDGERRRTLPPERDDDPYIGKIVSERYRVLSKLGEGGMGKVYLAEHIVIEKKVALKILSDDFARKADLVARFMQEAKAASRIGHENIVDITDFGQTDAGSVFFAMEHLEGADLATVIRQNGPMPLARVKPIINQICRALGAAHGKGIIHRDVKPENIFLIERDGRADFVKILDFGIAKMSALDESGERLTRTGMIFGTPEYMSPEQARGDRSDHRVDIYAVGCIAYEMLTGDVPFHAETFMGVLTKHMFETPDSISVRAPDARVSPDVEAIVMRALAKSRDERFQTMRELAVALAATDGGDADAVWGQEGSGQYHAPAPTVLSRAAPAVPKLKPSSKLPVVIGLALIATLGSLAVWRLKPQAVVPVVVAPEVVKPDPPPTRPAPPPLQVEPPPARITHVIEISSNVEGATAHRGDEILGRVPGKFSFDHATEPVTIVVTRKGYKSTNVVVWPDHAGKYGATLVVDRPTAPPTRKGNVAKKPEPKQPPAIAEPPSKPVSAKPPVQTSGPSTRDLKEPVFGN